MKNRFTLITLLIATILVMSVNAATLNCQQITESELSIPQFSTETIEIKCTASSGTVSNIQITPNVDPSSGLDISGSQTIASSISDSSSSTAKWTVEGRTPNGYDVSYTVQSDGTNSWTGASTTDVTVPSGAQLAITYNDAPSTYSSGDTLDIEIENIGGTTANNVKLKLNSGSTVNYPTTIAAGATASYSWTTSTGYDSADTYTTYVYIGSTLHDSIATVVSAADDDDDSSAAPAAAGGGGGGGGAGGGAGTGTPVSTGASKMMAWVAVVPGQILKFLPGSSDIPFSYIELISKSDIASMTLTVKAMDEKPQFVEEVKNQYKYMEVAFNGAAQENFEEGVKLTFRVLKSWVNENTDDKNNIFLSRYHNDVWNKLVTVLDSEDDEYFYYSATSPGFSYFAVSAEPKTVVEITEDESGTGLDDITGDVPSEIDAEGEDNTLGETVVKKSSSIFWIVLGALFMMMVAWLVYHHSVKSQSDDDKKEDKKEEPKESKESKDINELKEPKAKPKKD